MASTPTPPVSTVEYDGSPYHKRVPFQEKTPAYGLLADETECPPEIREAQVLAVLPGAIAASMREGRCSRLMDGVWPRYAWGRSSFRLADDASIDVTWEARVVNREKPSYKAYPITPLRHSQTMPVHVRRSLWPRD